MEYEIIKLTFQFFFFYNYITYKNIYIYIEQSKASICIYKAYTFCFILKWSFIR